MVGATGAQGGGLAHAVLSDPQSGYLVRALTRKPDSARAQALAAQGAQIVAADLDDANSLRAAFAGADAAFCVTNFWEHFSPEREIAQVRNMAEAAVFAGLRHVVWSTLEDTRRWMSLDDPRMPTLMGHYKVPHFDGKGEADAVFAALGVPTTRLLTSFYWDNLIHFGMGPKRNAAGRLVFALPMGDARLPGIAAADIGRCVLGLLRRGDDFVGRMVGIAGEMPTGAEMAGVLADGLGEPVDYQAMEPAAYRALGFPGAEDLGNMFQFKRDFNAGFCAARDPQLARVLNPELKSFRDWVAENAGALR